MGKREACALTCSRLCVKAHCLALGCSQWSTLTLMASRLQLRFTVLKAACVCVLLQGCSMTLHGCARL